MHQQLIPGLSKHVQSFHLAWLTRRIGIKSLVQFQEMLARGLALSLASYGAAFDLMEAFPSLIRAALYLIWWMVTGDIKLVCFLMSRYDDILNLLIVAGRVTEGSAMLEGDTQGSVLSTSDLLITLDLLGRLIMRDIQHRGLMADQVLGCFADDIHQAMLGSLEPACVIVLCVNRLGPLCGLKLGFRKMFIISDGGGTP